MAIQRFQKRRMSKKRHVRSKQHRAKAVRDKEPVEGQDLMRMYHDQTWRNVRLTLIHQQDGKCFYCDKSLTKELATIDHLLPISRGGTHHIGNLVAACEDCNLDKSDSTYEEYMAREVRYAK